MPRWLPGLLLFLLTCVVYAREPFNGFIWDDPSYVVDNPTLQTPGGLWYAWFDPGATPQYYPAVHTTFWVEARLWGTHHAAGYHVDNVLLHAAAAVLLWRALIAIGVPWPWLAAAVFAVHPVMVESVAWVTERKNVLSIAFYLLAFHAYRRTGLLRLGDAPARRPRRWYLAALLLFLLALFSKTVTCSLPAAILLVIYYRRGRITRADVTPLLPFFALGLGLSAVTAHLERTHVGANGPDFDWITPADRILIAGRAAWFYAGKVAWPARLIFMYPRWSIDPRRWWQWTYPAGVAAAVIGLWLARRRLGRGPLVAVLFFLGTLVPALGFVNVYPMRYSWVADHFQYLAAIGLIVLAVAVLDGLARRSLEIENDHEGTKGDTKYTKVESDRLATDTGLSSDVVTFVSRFVPSWSPSRAGTAARPILAAIVLVPLSVLTWRQQGIYHDVETLWRDTIARNPGSWMAHANLAHVLRDRHEDDAEWAEMLTALRLNPNVSDTHYDFGYALSKRGQWPAATAEFRRATVLGPTVAPAWSTLSRVLWEHGTGPADATAAVAAARRAVALNPDMTDANGVLSDHATATGDAAGAIRFADREAAADPENPVAHARLGGALARAGRPADAAGEFYRAVTLNPSDAGSWTNLGYCGLRLGRPVDAAAAFRRALAIDPSLAAARAGLQAATGGR
jgi:Flp pilus assembly protein TadD